MLIGLIFIYIYIFNFIYVYMYTYMLICECLFVVHCDDHDPSPLLRKKKKKIICTPDVMKGEAPVLQSILITWAFRRSK